MKFTKKFINSLPVNVQQNIAILNFKGAKISIGKGPAFKGYINGEYRDDKGYYLGRETAQFMDYCKNWDTLHQLIDIIKAMEPSIFNYDVPGMTGFNREKNALLSINLNNSKEQVFNAVMNFIYWYNDNKPKSLTKTSEPTL